MHSMNMITAFCFLSFFLLIRKTFSLHSADRDVLEVH